jgi:hypothetical protein
MIERRSISTVMPSIVEPAGMVKPKFEATNNSEMSGESKVAAVIDASVALSLKTLVGLTHALAFSLVPALARLTAALGKSGPWEAI